MSKAQEQKLGTCERALFSTKEWFPLHQQPHEKLNNCVNWRESAQPSPQICGYESTISPGCYCKLFSGHNGYHDYSRETAAQSEAGEPRTLKDEIIAMMKYRGWSLSWIHRSAYLHLEAAELAEAVRGKHGETLEESADVLITLLALSPHELSDISDAAKAKVRALMSKPRGYNNEQLAD